QRRSSPVSFGGREAGLTMQGGQAVGLFQGGLVEWHPCELTPLLLAQRLNSVIESGHQHVARRVRESQQDLCERLRRIRCHPAEQSGMHVSAGGLDSELDVDQAAE